MKRRKKKETKKKMIVRRKVRMRMMKMKSLFLLKAKRLAKFLKKNN